MSRAWGCGYGAVLALLLAGGPGCDGDVTETGGSGGGGGGLGGAAEGGSSEGGAPTTGGHAQGGGVSGGGGAGEGGVGEGGVGEGGVGEGGAPGGGGQGGGGGEGGAMPVASTAISIDDITPFDAPAFAFTKIRYSAEVYDDAGEFDPVASEVVVAEAGDYEICASLTSYPASLTLPFEIDLFIDDQRENALAGEAPGFQQGCRTVRLPAGARIDVRVRHEGPSPVTFAANGYWNWVTVRKAPSIVSVDGITTFTAQPSTFTKVPYSLELYDDTASFSEGDGRFTASADGDYEICASLTSYPASLAAPFELDLAIDGQRENALGYGAGFVSGCRTIRLAAGNNVEVWVHHTAATAVEFTPNAYWSWLTVSERDGLVSIDDVTAFDVPSDAFTIVPYSVEVFDDTGSFDTTSHAFTAPAAGDYEFCSSLISYPNTTTTTFELDLFVNGTRENAFAGASTVAQGGCRTLRLVAGDRVDVRVYQDSGATMSITPDAYWNWLTIVQAS